ncbi:adaptor protein MecA [Heyndrickxia sporothermodurans]|uniref:Adapter protein MecA n=1 Tax=Heyndrickxia sporothermodurans TaxID=46224 RepID=A0AB37HDT4_9BACI|nr:adaptor protein MecA [Heyndrickxia sporothermodurans]MBL5766797.1 adaptor protein MecA [Heyndrickxia sporothermodurans]MBL5771518.1 adaptor protein MecA [Heyndrickxia sporothermodurans]MBL5774108.1 adaptor protein MecA [Heyndrickxia sporothermodurans]MBL5777525.1 adaptor protein MecA [Heyndrickxia sporothermodurans]MBL5781033.1 adaptor protein MecA [Heyndrickxia sporothermodurans]
MEIERINENTVKFYISYGDIEERGFNREEIWYDRERSEELFWEMMDEIHHEEEFVPEGPLWIQVQALDKGLEVLVTKAQLSKDGQRFELPISEEKLKELPINDRLEEFLDEHFQSKGLQEEDEILDFMLAFKDFEDVISLSKQSGLDDIITKLLSYNNKYYLYVEFPEEVFDEESIDNVLSILLEYGEESSFTVHRLQEYGNTIIDGNVFDTIQKYFK